MLAACSAGRQFLFLFAIRNMVLGQPRGALSPEPHLTDERAGARRRMRGPQRRPPGRVGQRCSAGTALRTSPPLGQGEAGLHWPQKQRLGWLGRPTHPSTPCSQSFFSSILTFPSRDSTVTTYFLRTQKSIRQDSQETGGQEQPGSSPTADSVLL